MAEVPVVATVAAVMTAVAVMAAAVVKAAVVKAAVMKAAAMMAAVAAGSNQARWLTRHPWWAPSRL